MTLNAESALSHPTVGKALTEIQIGAFATLALYTLFERRQEEGRFAPWLRSIPRSLPVLAQWSDEELKLLNGSPVIEALSMRRSGVNASYFAAFRSLEEKGFADVFPPKDYPIDDYIWACNVIFQSAMTLQIPADAKGNVQAREIMALVPMVDFAKRASKVLHVAHAVSTKTTNP